MKQMWNVTYGTYVPIIESVFASVGGDKFQRAFLSGGAMPSFSCRPCRGFCSSNQPKQSQHTRTYLLSQVKNFALSSAILIFCLKQSLWCPKSALVEMEGSLLVRFWLLQDNETWLYAFSSLYKKL